MMRRKNIYTLVGTLLIIGSMISFESCQVKDEPSYERIQRQSKSGDEREDEGTSTEISIEMESDEMEEEVEEILFEAKEWAGENLDVAL